MQYFVKERERKKASDEGELFFEWFLYVHFLLLTFVCFDFRRSFFRLMAYNTTGSTYRATHSGDSRNSFQQQPDEHIYEEQPYVNDRPMSRQSVSGESRRIDFKQQPERHMYEERPYINDRPVTRQSIGGESRRSGAVRFMFFLYF